MRVWQRRQSTVQSPELLPPPSPHAFRARRLAWGVISGAFLVWCALLAVSGLTAKRYYESASNPLSARLEIQRGEIFFQDDLSTVQARANSGRDLIEGTVLDAPKQAEADVKLFESSALHLYPESQVVLSTLRLGRFTDSASRVEVQQTRGAVFYKVSGQLPNGEGMTLATPHGTFALQRGEYLAWVHEKETKVTAYSGKGSVRVGEQVERFRFDQTIRTLADGGIQSPAPMGEDLIANGSFIDGWSDWQAVDEQEKGRKDVPGVRVLENLILDSKAIKGLRVHRETAKDTHNETGVIQKINRDVLPYRNLIVRAWVKVDYASLSGGGYAGSEYPMMIQVNYVDTTGGRPLWSHGFYYANPENRPVVNAEQIQHGVWLYYQGDLTELGDKPAYINSMRVQASGHDFQATITRIELIAQ